MRKTSYHFVGAIKRLKDRFWRDLGLQIAFFYSLFVIPVIFISFFFARAFNDRLRADVIAADLIFAKTIAQETELNLTNARFAAQELVRYSITTGDDHEMIEELYAKLSGSLAATNPISFLSDWWVIENREPIGLDVIPAEAFSSRDYFQQTELSGPLISNGWRSGETWQPLITSVMPLWDEFGKIDGVVVSNIKLNSLSASLATMISKYRTRSNTDFQGMIVDGSRKIIAHPNRSMLLRSTLNVPASVVNEVLRGREGSQVSEFDGKEMLYSYAPIPGTPWGVIISQPTSAAFATSNAFMQSMLMVVAFFTAVGMAFWIGLSFKVIRPLEKLAIYSQSISGDEEFSEKQRKELVSLANRPDQVGHLTDTLVQMESDIEDRLNELATLLQTSAAVVSTLENQVVLDRILEQVERLLDVKMSAIVALDRRDGVFRAQASRGITQKHAAQLTVNPQDNESIILRTLRSRTAFQISDTENNAPFETIQQQAREAGYRSVLAIPLQTLYAPPSALLIFHADPHVFTDREISLLASFANHAAMAIENATLYARSDLQLQEQTRRLEALILSLKDGLILENLDGKITYANRQIGSLVNLPIEDMVGTPVEDVVNLLLAGVENAEWIRQNIQLNQDKMDPAVDEFEIEHRGRKMDLRIQVFNVTDSQGTLIGRGRIFTDVTADRELDHMKSRLVSTVSHELRTPLAAIKGYATTLLAEDVEWDLESQHEFLEIISSETDRLSAMVTDLLDLSKIEAGSLSIHRSEVLLDELIRFASQQAYPPPDGRLRVEIPPDLPRLYLDKRLVEAVFRNLIENATKYAGENTPIKITAEVVNDNLLVFVQDEGPGIPVKYQERIFESFFRSDESLMQIPSGFGLGLTICKGFIESHGGRIWIEPCSVGACFAFSLPLNEN